MDFSLDIKEKDVGAVRPPSFPQPKSSTTGFPEHRKRTRVSAFKKQRQGADSGPPELQNAPTTSTQQAPAQTRQPARPGSTAERAAIDRENRDLLASLSPEQIEEERRELLDRLDPSILQMLLRRANLDQPSGPSPFDEPAGADANTAEPPRPQVTPAIVVGDTSAPEQKESKPKKSVRFDEDAPPPEPPADLFDPSSEPPPLAHPSSSASADTFAANTTHFPHPKPLPDLDPADPDFLETLHSKYFPNLPADPSKLAWMAPIPTPGSAADRESPYYPGQPSLSIAALRFDFKGRLVPPTASRAIPVTKGLHHHGLAPEAAGYTISELGILARSAVPAQRCVAFQTLGRILFRLGQGEWGGVNGGDGDDLAKGLWRTVQEAKVIESLLEAAEVPEGQGHRGSRSYAIEALWLFEKGGWKEKFQGR